MNLKIIENIKIKKYQIQFIKIHIYFNLVFKIIQSI